MSKKVIVQFVSEISTKDDKALKLLDGSDEIELWKIKLGTRKAVKCWVYNKHHHGVSCLFDA